MPSTPPPKQLLQNRNGNGGGCVDLFADLTTVSTDDIPPPLPKRNNRTLITDTQNNPSAQYVNGEVPLREENGNYDDGCLNQCLTSNKQSKQHISKPMFTQSRSEHENLAGLASAAPATNEGRDRCSSLGSRKGKTCKKSLSCGGGMIVDNKMYAGGGQPPPLPPRVPLNPGYEPDGANSINKQLSYPLVATCATLVNNCVSNPQHFLFSFLFIDFSTVMRRVLLKTTFGDVELLIFWNFHFYVIIISLGCFGKFFWFGLFLDSI